MRIPRRAATSTVLLLLPVALATGCTGGAEPDAQGSASPTPTGISRAVPTPKPFAIDAAPSPGSVPTTREATAAATKQRNEVGEVWTLDAAAAAACAQAEFALTALEEGEAPDGHVKKALAAVEPSAATAVAKAAAALPASGRADRGQVVAFLKVCTQGGYEL